MSKLEYIGSIIIGFLFLGAFIVAFVVVDETLAKVFYLNFIITSIGFIGQLICELLQYYKMASIFNKIFVVFFLSYFIYKLASKGYTAYVENNISQIIIMLPAWLFIFYILYKTFKPKF